MLNNSHIDLVVADVLRQRIFKQRVYIKILRSRNVTPHPASGGVRCSRAVTFNKTSIDNSTYLPRPSQVTKSSCDRSTELMILFVFNNIAYLFTFLRRKTTGANCFLPYSLDDTEAVVAICS